MTPDRRPPCAVKVACTVTTGGMERRVGRYRALSLPTQEWLTLFEVEHPFKESSSWFEQLFDLDGGRERP